MKLVKQGLSLLNTVAALGLAVLFLLTGTMALIALVSWKQLVAAGNTEYDMSILDVRGRDWRILCKLSDNPTI